MLTAIGAAAATERKSAKAENFMMTVEVGLGGARLLGEFLWCCGHGGVILGVFICFPRW